ncbi:MAG TPA: outer membrane lipoprotein-sorting protein [Thermodesulfobacteriota bacterium]
MRSGTISDLKNIIFAGFFGITLLFPAPSFSALAPPADEIVAKADEIRSPQLDYTVGVTVVSMKPGAEPREARYEVLVKGKDKTIIKTLSPAFERGRTLLMLGRDLWAYLPDISKPIRISLQQRLLGEVANGDIARANFSGDYKAVLLKKEKIEKASYHVLELTAIGDDVTYNKVLYWVRSEDYRPHKAEFYALSGRLLKTCVYGEYREMAGRMRPSRLTLSDPLVKGQLSTIDYHDMKVKGMPEKLFTKDYMKKLKY